MPESIFFDTNILLYADDRSAGVKRRQAAALISKHLGEGTAVFSIQVLQEYYAAATRKLGVDPDIAQQKVEIFARAKVVRLTETDVISVIELHRINRLSFWDALIVQAVRLAGCSTLFSEDAIGGGKIGSIRVVDPFR